MSKPKKVHYGVSPYTRAKKRRCLIFRSIKCACISALVFSVAFLSMIPLSSAVIVKGGEFQINLALGERVLYKGKPVEVVTTLLNTSGEVQLVDFEGDCQSTFRVTNESGEVVYPRSAEETPCNNEGYEKFLIYPSQKKTYRFVIPNSEKAPVFDTGTYHVTGTVTGFGQTNSISLEVIEKPDFFAKEFELCEGLTGQVCGPGLACKHRGGFTDGAGICLAVDNNFTPIDRCSNGVGGCFNDTEGHPQADVIDKFALLDRIKGYDDGTFRPNENISVESFSALVSKISGKSVKIITQDKFVRRDTAVAVLYKVYVDNKEPRTLSGSPFVDINNSKHKNFIDSSYNLGLVTSNTQNRFYPRNHLTRAHALLLIDRFENHAR